MTNNDANRRPTPPNKQQKYRQSQVRKGLVRFEIQVNTETKTQFDALVQAEADECS
jgi:hypothetical protein